MLVLITHPGLQHAHQLAWAVEEAGHLAGLWSGIPVRDSRLVAAWQWGRLGLNLRAVPISSKKRSHCVVFPFMRRCVSAWLQRKRANAFSHRLDHLYDWCVARRVAALKPDMVVCYENSALRTFIAAKKVGAVCLLDAASVHYSKQRQQLSVVGQVNPNWVDEHKQREIDLADAILTCSDLAANSYVSAGVPATKLVAVPLGADLAVTPLHKKTSSEVVRFVFVGALRAVKGVDLLLDIFEQLQDEAVPAHLTLIGGVAERDLATKARSLANVTLVPFMEHPAVFEEMARHDVLVLASRFDSFGMVVAEAMSVGVPALVTDQVGAKCIIEQHPQAGWIVPCEIDAIRKKILDLIVHRDQIAGASNAALRAAEDYQWSSYRTRVVAALERIYVEKMATR